MINKDKKTFFSVLAAGIFYGVAFPPMNLFFLIFFSFIILLDVNLKCRNLKQVIFRTYSVFFISGLIAVSWIALSGMRENADRFLIAGGVFVIFVYPLFFIPSLIILYYLNKNFLSLKIKNIQLLLFPFLWTGFEYTQTLGQINFPWLFAGNSMTYNLSKIQYAEFTGVFGVSFWICLLSVMMYFLFSNLALKHLKLISMKSLILILIIILIYFLPDLYNSVSVRNYSVNEKIRIGIVQPNVNPWKKWTGRQLDLIYFYKEQITQLHSKHPEIKLIILPETALPYYFREKYFEERFEILKNLCDSINVPLLIGTPDLEIYDDQQSAPPDAKVMKNSGMKYDTYNSAVLFEPSINKDDFQKHRKIKLVIGSERMPYQESLPFLDNLIEWGVGISNWQIGKDTTLFVLPGEIKFNTAICYESVYPGFFADFVRKGADFSVIITNDGWWGKFFGTYQHNRFAVFRAIENRRWIARCANTGISDFIDPEGNYFEETSIDEVSNIVFDAGLIKEKTFYTINGDLFAKTCLYSGIIIFVLSFFFRKKI